MEECVKIPENFYKLHTFVIHTSDVIFVNRNEFMITSASKIKYVTVDNIPSLKAGHISKS